MPAKGSCSFPSVWSAVEGLPRTVPTYIFGFLWPACLGHRAANSDQVSWRFTWAEQWLKNHIAGILKIGPRSYYGQYAEGMFQCGLSVGEGRREVKLNVKTDYSHLYGLTQNSLSFRTISADMVKEDELIRESCSNKPIYFTSFGSFFSKSSRYHTWVLPPTILASPPSCEQGLVESVWAAHPVNCKVEWEFKPGSPWLCFDKIPTGPHFLLFFSFPIQMLCLSPCQMGRILYNLDKELYN